jgi:(1->4)-alpha-D-glucan 1-alpha-D-glucosylmutase
MAGDVDNLALNMKRVFGQHRHGRDITLHGLKQAIVEVLAQFPVYRTYVDADSLTDFDSSRIREAVDRARSRLPDFPYELNFIEDFLLLKFAGGTGGADRPDWAGHVMRFQQFTAPLMAKGFEDTFLYVYNRLISLNEVGGDPSRFGTSREEFHRFNQRRAAQWPDTMNATSTHDGKRGEDVRARINVLSEMPLEWEKRVRSWMEINASLKTRVGNIHAPDRNDEYALYQTMVGALPFYEEEYPEFRDRLKGYAIKAVREAKVHSGWINPNSAYEEAFLGFVDGLFRRDSEFFADFEEFREKVAHYGIVNSLSQTLLKIASPGLPDFYQGSELWDLNLVDPDNRRPVDFDKRSRYLREIRERMQSGRQDLLKELLENPGDGHIKLFLTTAALYARAEYRDVFQGREYRPLEADGNFKDHLVAFVRRTDSVLAMVAVPRFCAALCRPGNWPLGPEIWGETRVVLPDDVPPVSCTDLFSGKTVDPSRDGSYPVGALFSDFPAALLISKEAK